MKLNITFTLFLSSCLLGQSAAPNAELIQRIEILEKRMSKLENANNVTQEDLNIVTTKGVGAETASERKNLFSENTKENKSFITNLRLQLKSEDVKAKGPWTDKETWESVKNNLTSFKIRKLLGNPTKIKTSLNPRIERVYHYIGDLNADGEEETGIVNFFRDKVISFKSPF